MTSQIILRLRHCIALLLILFSSSYTQAACVIDGSPGTVYASNTNVTSFSLNTPASHPSGDLLLAVINFAWSGSNAADQPASSGSNYNLQYCSSATGDTNVCFYTRVATGSDAPNYTWTTTHSGFPAGVVFALAGCNTTTPVDSGTTTTNTCFTNAGGASTVSCSATAATLANAGDAVIAGAGVNDGNTSCNSTNSWGAVSGYTVETACAGGGNSGAGGNFDWSTFWYQAFSSAGSTGPFSSTWGDTTIQNNGILAEGFIAIAPAATTTNGAVILMNKADSLNELALNLTAHASQAWFMP